MEEKNSKKVTNLNVRQDNVKKLNKPFRLILLPIVVLAIIASGETLSPIMAGALCGIVLGGIKSLTK